LKELVNSVTNTSCNNIRDKNFDEKIACDQINLGTLHLKIITNEFTNEEKLKKEFKECKAKLDQSIQ